MELIYSFFGIFVLAIIISIPYYLKRPLFHKSLHEYADILNSVPFPAVILDQSDTALLLINHRASHMLGISAPEFGQHIHYDFFVNVEKKMNY